MEKTTHNIAPVICGLRALSGYAPDTVVANADLTKFVDTSDQWIVERTGIKNRHQLDKNQNASDLALEAAKLALLRSNTDPAAITHIIAATCTPDYLSPSVACIVAGKLDVGNVMAFDIGAACSGFIYGLNICRAILTAEPQSRILFICAEAMTRRVNWLDRSTCVLFGDAAAATIMDANPENSLCSVVDVICQSDGKQKDLIIVGGGTACQYRQGEPVNGDFFISMQGRDTYRHAVRQMVSACHAILDRNNLSVEDIDILVPHQANMRIVEAVGNRLGFDPKKVFVNLADYGNTSAASIPLALSEALDQKIIKPGDMALVVAFGAGLTWGTALLRF